MAAQTVPATVLRRRFWLLVRIIAPIPNDIHSFYSVSRKRIWGYASTILTPPCSSSSRCSKTIVPYSALPVKVVTARRFTPSSSVKPAI
jgi:hypothetical protein